MHKFIIVAFFDVVLMFAPLQVVLLAQLVTLDDIVAPGPNQSDEPISEEFSLDRATNFLDSASLQWQKHRKCMTCHTNYAYLYARPGISSEAPAHQDVRRFAEQLVLEIPGKGQRKNIELSLFILESDIGETTNLADQHPDVVKRLQEYAQQIRVDLGDGKQVGPGRRAIGSSDLSR